MIAIDPPVRNLFEALEPNGPFSNRVPPVNSLLLADFWTEFISQTPKQEPSPIKGHNGASTAC